jgi:hypothetical protein
MKRVYLIVSLFFVLVSCSIEDDGPNFHSVLLPIMEVEVPQEFVMGETYTIKVWYERPSTCHAFNGFYYDKQLNVRTIAVQNIVTESGNCEALENEIIEQTFDFYVTNNGSYIFKFWQGTNDSGEDVFYEVEVPVVD